jgi:hypothetical protein
MADRNFMDEFSYEQDDYAAQRLTSSTASAKAEALLSWRRSPLPPDAYGVDLADRMQRDLTPTLGRDSCYRAPTSASFHPDTVSVSSATGISSSTVTTSCGYDAMMTSRGTDWRLDVHYGTVDGDPVVTGIVGAPASTRRPGEGPTTTVNNVAPSAAKSYTPHIKLGVYKGDTSLETFLVKFENCSAYCNWSERDRFFHLSNALEGAAGQVLWGAICNSADDLIQSLRRRFGERDHRQRYRAELKTRRRHDGESLQQLYRDICRLLTLAYPGPRDELLYDVVAVDAFLDALNDKQLRREIMKQKPPNLDAAVAVACELETYDVRPPVRRDCREPME